MINVLINLIFFIFLYFVFHMLALNYEKKKNNIEQIFRQSIVAIDLIAFGMYFTGLGFYFLINSPLYNQETKPLIHVLIPIQIIIHIVVQLYFITRTDHSAISVPVRSSLVGYVITALILVLSDFFT